MPASRPKRVLIVERQPALLRQIQPWLDPSGPWTLDWAANASEAFQAMEDQAYQVVVLDLTLAGGMELLKELRDRWPRAARVVVAGQTDLKYVIGILAAAHQFLPQPCDPLLLSQTIGQALRLLDLMEDPDLEGAIDNLDMMPTLPKAYWRLLEALNNPDLSMNDIASLVALDPTLSAKALQMVNSSYFGLEQSIRSVRQAVGYLGPEAVAGMGLSASILRALKGELKELRPLALSAQPGAGPNLVLESIQDPTWAEQAFTTSLVHDIGLILFSIRMPRAPGAADGPEDLVGIWACPEP